jgi:hypothetical protein
MAMEMLLFIVAWFVIGFGIATLIGAAASVGDASLIKPATRPSEIVQEGVNGANAHVDATEAIAAIERRRMRRKPAACYPTLLLAGRP